ncbi:hypothetical protein BDP27DRAFT_1418526 [Rhodocollybia butyracea]|uniref:Uncharacterized protein n=1 Tax=Rhodocollybia butyracea TaxID=206335 RepID=A0A9P5PTB3_9AGAR|nr:hypothetical protein BDP27DRAFT_1418526 [Rhodocollybia butyracea]
MQSVARYSKIQTISRIRFIFLSLIFIASVAYAAPMARKRKHGEVSDSGPHVKVGFLADTGERLEYGLVHRENIPRVHLETPLAQDRVHEVLELVFPSLEIPEGTKVEWSDANYYYPERMAGNDLFAMVFFNIRPSNVAQGKLKENFKGKVNYRAWIAYGPGEYGAATYASVKHNQTVNGKEVVTEFVRLSGKTDTEKAQWSTFDKMFMSKMPVWKNKDLVPLEPEKWIAPPLAPLRLSFVTAKGEPMTKKDPELAKDTEVMKSMTQQLLQSKYHTLHVPNPLAKEHLLWATDTVPFTTPEEKKARMVFLLLERADFGKAYAWIAYADNGTSCEIAGVMNNVEEWEKHDREFWEKTDFFSKSSNNKPFKKLRPGLSDKEVVQVLSMIRAKPVVFDNNRNKGRA